MERYPKDDFFDSLGRLAVTFKEVTLQTGYSEVTPDEVAVTSRFSRNVPLNIPLVSAAMDRVTESEMAIAMAKLGGLGIIHRSLSPEKQGDEVDRVKFHLNGVIPTPICVREDETIASILAKREEKKYPFHSFLVVNSDKKLVGVLTGNDFDFCDTTSLPASAVMTRELITAPEGTKPDAAYELMKKHRRKLLPIVTAAGEVAALYTFSDMQRIRRRGPSTIVNVDHRGQLRVGAAIGVGSEALERAALLVSKNVDVLVIDTSHADSKNVYDTLHDLKKWCSTDVVVGNISQGDSAKRLIQAGADGIKIGQGPGSICTTRIIAGYGRPQVSAVYRCALAARGSDVPVCADGGLEESGDIPVAIGAGAHSVMLGSMLAGTKEAPGDTHFWEGRQWKEYRGMGSIGAMEASRGARERYGQAHRGKDQLVPEGIEGRVPYKGEVAPAVYQYVGGLRIGMGGVGAATIEELRAKADFDHISATGQAESHPHGVTITKEAPNYKRSR